MSITIPQLLAIITNSALLLTPLAFYFGYKRGYYEGQVDEAEEIHKRRLSRISVEEGM